MKQVTIMCRVSSDEQAKGYSLDDQLEKLTNYCTRKGYEIVHVIREDHSAKSFDRPEWKKWIDLVKKKKLPSTEILFTSWDRFSRDLVGALNMIKYLRGIGVAPQSIEQPIDYDIPENLFMLAIYLTNPDVDNQRRSIKIRGGIRQGLKQGRWARSAVLGYKRAKDGSDRSTIVPDPEKAWIIETIFDQFTNGIPQVEIRKELAKKGAIVSKNNLSKILRRNIYMGKITIPAHEDEAERIIDGIHEPLISEAQFLKAQQLLNNFKLRNKRAPKYMKLREDFPLRGLLKCNHCEETLTASSSRGKLGKRYAYYHCNHCKQQRESSETVHQAFNQLLKSIEIDSDAHDLYTAILANLMGESQEKGKLEAKNLKVQLEKITQRIENMQDLMLDGKLDSDEYVSIKTRYSGQIIDLKEKIKTLSMDNTEVKRLTTSSLNFFTNLTAAYENATIHLKHKIVGSIFPELIKFDGEKCRTPKINSVLELFSSFNGGLGENEKGQLTQFCQLSPSVERGGFEPPLRFRKHAFQACAFNHSATSPDNCHENTKISNDEA